ncbi:MAG: hypothetical protein JEZ08_24195 [Clostridiales bacterium]|nr:hypothetical protein [Clostridiales bacterium]
MNDQGMKLEMQKKSIWNYLNARGIQNEKELNRALDEMKPINIGLMVVSEDQLITNKGA